MAASSIFWEPWSPTRGQRVRVRKSAECRVVWCGVPDGLEGIVIDSFEGLWGTPTRDTSGHDYLIHEGDCDGCAEGCVTRWISAAELEPISQEGRDGE